VVLAQASAAIHDFATFPVLVPEFHWAKRKKATPSAPQSSNVDASRCTRQFSPAGLRDFARSEAEEPKRSDNFCWHSAVTPQQNRSSDAGVKGYQQKLADKQI